MATTDKDFKVKNGISVGGSGVFGGTVSVASPTQSGHAATKEYVDNAPAKATISASPPSNPSLGDQWYNSEDGVLYMYYDNFWVEASSGGADANIDSLEISSIMGVY